MPTAPLDEAAPRGDRARGEALFQQHCEKCHGSSGPFVRIRGRELLSRATTGFLRHALRTGRPPTQMPSYQATLGAAGIEDLLAYLRSLPSWETPEAPPAAVRPPPLPLGKVPQNPAGHAPRGFATYPSMTQVDTVQRELARGARLQLLDARAPSDYLEGHIAGAVSVPFYDPTPYLQALPRDTWLVCYCGCPHAESGALAEQLLRAGFSKVTVLDEGLGLWIERGYAVQRGSQP